MVDNIKRINRYGEQIGGQGIVPTHVIGTLIQMFSEGLYVTHHHHGGHFAVLNYTSIQQKCIGSESEDNGDGNAKYRTKQAFPEIVAAAILFRGFLDIVQSGVLSIVEIFHNLKCFFMVMICR